MESVYSWASAEERHKNKEILAGLESQYDRIVEQWTDFKDLPRAREKAHAQMKALEAEMDRLKASTVDLAAEVRSATASLAKHLTKLYRARKEIAASEAPRMALALREVFERIVLHARPYQHGPQLQNRVHAIEFVPLGGVAATILVDKKAASQPKKAAKQVDSTLTARQPRS